MKNYYEILEVNRKASKEVIEKAYKVLVKKYHPDTNKNSDKKIKDINEAYEVLSNDFLRAQYDLELEKEEQNKVDNIINRYNKSSSRQKAQKEEVLTNNDESKKDQVGNPFGLMLILKDLFKRSPKNEKKEITKIDILAVGLTIIVLILIGVILWFIPFTNGWIRELLFENALFNAIAGLFSK